MIDVYLACPYSDPSEEAKAIRLQVVTEVAGQLSARGLAVYSPLTASVPMVPVMEAETGRTDDWETWAAIDKKFIAGSRELWVLTMPGWVESVGVTAETEYMLDEVGRPVRFVPHGVRERSRVIEVLIRDWERRYGPLLGAGEVQAQRAAA
jgi:hypothetical protein